MGYSLCPRLFGLVVGAGFGWIGALERGCGGTGRYFVTNVSWNSAVEFRDNWEDGNPASWGTSPQYQVSDLYVI